MKEQEPENFDFIKENYPKINHKKIIEIIEDTINLCDKQKKKQVEELKKVCFRSLTYDGKKLVEYKEIEEEINKIFNDVTEEKK